jgi:hypothetical protein
MYTAANVVIGLFEVKILVVPTPVVLFTSHFLTTRIEPPHSSSSAAAVSQSVSKRYSTRSEIDRVYAS